MNRNVDSASTFVLLESGSCRQFLLLCRRPFFVATLLRAEKPRSPLLHSPSRLCIRQSEQFADWVLLLRRPFFVEIPLRAEKPCSPLLHSPSPLCIRRSEEFAAIGRRTHRQCIEPSQSQRTDERGMVRAIGIFNARNRRFLWRVARRHICFV